MLTESGQGLIKFGYDTDERYSLFFNDSSTENGELEYGSKHKSSGNTHINTAIEIFHAPPNQTFLVFPAEKETKYYLRYH